ncbi:sialate O-acetylesterase [Pedobacter sp. ISL-68]|uniref:sialate O-acetylesterase n=1 Tax=unclassified Pedobacter TaxID=2628915 RepID=UPI001BEA8EF9|nr:MULTISPECIES: sialate O-acetylesterase [unclassified Pedobacter]MBT2560947.1 sialate O-acetylesterase [Pedobacter sp. ISL-64]MBT2590336.1 sialate O-acetylesterase [Pedobacter sp. ISL-68]
MMRIQIQAWFIFFMLFFFIHEGHAQITLPKVFGDSMVLQRGIKIPVWGSAAPGQHIIAALGKFRATAIADHAGQWKLLFPVLKAGGPYELSISEVGKPNAEIKLKGILIGDVWLASGQSNMEWSVQQSQDATKEIANADFSQIRFLQVGHDKKLTPQYNIPGGTWAVCNPVNVPQFSAVAYYFSRKIHRGQHVPIGIIQSTWGGTPIESWTSREQLLTSPITKTNIAANDTLSEQSFVNDSLSLIRFWDIVYHPQNNTDKTIPATGYDDSGWPTVEMPRLIKDFGIGPYEGMVWLRKKIILPESFFGKDLTLHLGHPEINYSMYFNGEEICKTIWNSDPKQSYTIPAKLIRKGENTISLRIAMLWGGGGLNPPTEGINITDGTVKVSLAGIWRYQKDLEPGLPKIKNYQNYPSLLFNAMINPVIPFGIKGFLWYQGEANGAEAYNYRKLFPMLIDDWRKRWKQGDLPFLYVQLANFKKTKPLPFESEWAELREAQTLTLSQPNTGMACIIDIGEADNIHPVNKQEVGRRLALNANKLVYKQNLTASGPLYKSYRKEANRIYISFANISAGLQTKDAKEITGFSIAGNDQQFYWAKATIKGKYVVVYADQVRDPQAVRYAWADNPECNLINAEGLPAIPFRTDNWKGITQK